MKLKIIPTAEPLQVIPKTDSSKDARIVELEELVNSLRRTVHKMQSNAQEGIKDMGTEGEGEDGKLIGGESRNLTGKQLLLSTTIDKTTRDDENDASSSGERGGGGGLLGLRGDLNVLLVVLKEVKD